MVFPQEVNQWAYLPSPSRGYFSLGPVHIHFYALCIILGACLGILLVRKRWEARGGNVDDLYDALLLGLPSGVIGARIYHVVTDHQLYFGQDAPNSPWDAMKIWQGGLGIWGGIFFGGLVVYLYCMWKKIPAGDLADAMAPGILLAQGIGRVGNWFNQELYGRHTEVPWALEIYEREGGVSTGHVIDTVHPTFAYEALWCFIGVGILLLVDRICTIGYGRLFSAYVVVYCLGRFGIELMRSDTANTILGLRVNTWVSGICLVVGVIFFIIGKRGRRTTEEIATFREDRADPTWT